MRYLLSIYFNKTVFFVKNYNRHFFKFNAKYTS